VWPTLDFGAVGGAARFTSELKLALGRSAGHHEQLARQ
jgi:hypothetical protein